MAHSSTTTNDPRAPVTIELNPRDLRSYDRLREKVIAAQPGAPTGVGGLLLLLPDLVVLLVRLTRDPRVPATAKAIAALGIGYTLSPIDLIPEIFLGPLGWVDDIVIVGAALSRILNHVHPDLVRGHWSGQGDALEAIQRMTRWTEEQLTGRVRGAVRWLFARVA